MDKIALPVRLKALDRGEKTTELCLTIRRETSATLHQLLHVEITDEKDAFFLFSLTLGESDFHVLKSEQRLLVDFQTFPEKFVEMLKDVPCRLYAALVMQSSHDAHLSLVESNQFRELPHLCLKFRKGNDEALKEYMSSKLNDFKASNETLTTRAEQAEEENARLRQRCSDYEENVRRLTGERQALGDNLLSKHSMELGGLRESHALKLEEIQRKSQEERAEMEKTLRSKVEELSNKLSKYETELQTVTQEKYQLETADSRNRELLASQANELASSEATVLQLRTECKSLENSKYGLEKQITELEWKARSLNERLSDKENYTQNQVALTEQTQAKSTSMEETLNVYKQQVQQLEEKFQHSVTEIEKGNSIIQKLHTQIKNFKSKLRLKDVALLEQEKNMGAIQNELAGEKKQEDSLNSRLAEAKTREDKLRRELESISSNLDEAHEMIKNNQQVIDYLNKQLTERDLKTFAPIQTTPTLGPPSISPGSALGSSMVPSAAPKVPFSAMSSTLTSNPSPIATEPFRATGSAMASSTRDRNDVAARNARVSALLAERGLGALPATSSTPTPNRQLQDYSDLAPAPSKVEHVRYRPVVS